jgi:hypothetical protein
LLAVTALSASAFLVGRWRQSQDADWCRRAQVVAAPGGKNASPDPDAARQRAACVALRRSQRSLFGAVWRTGGKEMADCGVQWGRYQQLSEGDPAAAKAELETRGIHDPLEPSSAADEHRFIQHCLASGPGQTH